MEAKRLSVGPYCAFTYIVISVSSVREKQVTCKEKEAGTSHQPEEWRRFTKEDCPTTIKLFLLPDSYTRGSRSFMRASDEYGESNNNMSASFFDGPVRNHIATVEKVRKTYRLPFEHE